MLQFFDYSATNETQELTRNADGYIATSIDSIECDFLRTIHESPFTKRLDQTLNPEISKAALSRSYCGAVFRVHKVLGLRCLVLPTRKPLTLAGRCFHTLLGSRYLEQETFSRDGGCHNSLWSQDVVLTSETNSDTLLPVSLPYSSGGLAGVPGHYFLESKSLGAIDNRILLVFLKVGHLTCPVARIYMNGRKRNFDYDMRNVFSDAPSLLVGYLGMASQNEMSSAIRMDFRSQWSEFFGAA
jgi:hypothetical protein